MSFPSTTARPRRRLHPSRLAGTTLAAALVLGAVACGGGGSSAGGDFCGSMKSLQKEFSDPSQADAAAMTSLFDKMSKITPPDALATDWNTMISAKDFINDPSKMDSSKIDAFTKASDNIDKYLQNTCHLSG